MIFGLPLQ